MSPKLEHHSEEVMLSVWWNMRGVAHWELLPSHMTVKAEVSTVLSSKDFKAKLEADGTKQDNVLNDMSH